MAAIPPSKLRCAKRFTPGPATQERNVLLTRWRFETAEEMSNIIQTLSSPEAAEHGHVSVQFHVEKHEFWMVLFNHIQPIVDDFTHLFSSKNHVIGMVNGSVYGSLDNPYRIGMVVLIDDAL